MNDQTKKSPGTQPASGARDKPVPPRNDRPTVGSADGGSGTPDDGEIARPSDKGMRGLDKSGGTRGGGR